MRHRRRRRGQEQGAKGSSGERIRGRAIGGGRRKKRTLVKARDVVGNEARGTEAVVKDLHLNLATVSMSGQRKLDAEFCSATDSVWMVREAHIGRIAADQRVDIGKG